MDFFKQVFCFCCCFVFREKIKPKGLFTFFTYIHNLLRKKTLFLGLQFAQRVFQLGFQKVYSQMSRDLYDSILHLYLLLMSVSSKNGSFLCVIESFNSSSSAGGGGCRVTGSLLRQTPLKIMRYKDGVIFHIVPLRDTSAVEQIHFNAILLEAFKTFSNFFISVKICDTIVPVSGIIVPPTVHIQMEDITAIHIVL